MEPIEPATLDGLWERIRGGDRRAARELVDHLIIEGDEEQVQAASRAIGRHFEREARDLLRRAHMVEGESRRGLTTEALEALTTAAVATRLPELIRASLAAPGAPAAAGLPVPSLPPVTDLSATGVDGGIDLTWKRSVTDLVVTGQEVIVYQDLEIIQQSAVLDPTVERYRVNGLTNGASYLLVVNTLSAAVTSTANVTGTAGLVRSALPAATGLTATPGNGSLTFGWSDPATTDATITGYQLVLTGDNLPREAIVTASAAAAAPREHTFTDLQNGTAYTLSLQTIGTVADAANQLGQTASLVAIPGATGTPFVPRVPALTADPLLFFDQNILGEIASAEKLRTEALSIAQKWRYEYLKEKAVGAAQEALAYDRQIVDLMSMALNKSLAAETQLTPVILDALDGLDEDTESVLATAKGAEVQKAIEALGDTITSSVLLTAILEWMARNDALDVWIDLFDALIDDASDFDTSLTHTKSFLDDQYDSSAFGKAVKEVARLQLARVGPFVDAAVRPLRDAIRELIGATSAQMGAAFAAFDLPILMSDGGTVNVPNVNPLSGSLAALADAVERLESELTRAIREKLLNVAEGKNRALFRSFMIAYFVTPILAALAVSMAGGPAAAGVIAGAVAVGAEALLHKVARWVLGPLQDPVEELEAKVAKAFRALHKAIANQAPLKLSDPKEGLAMLEDELRLIRTLLPRAFVDDLAALLAEARTLTLSSGLLHALAAERALGYDHGTAFDRILPSYQWSFTPASLLPGGGDNGLFSGAALLRDLERLDQDLIRMTDGRDVEITRRLSLFQLLGGIGDPITATGMALGRFADFLRTGQTAVEIRPETLLDPVSPGVYRSIVEGVSVIGLARAPVVNTLAAATGLSVTVSHSGRSTMRVRRDANASAPPTALPAGLVDEGSYVLGMTHSDQEFPFTPNTLEWAVWSVIVAIPRRPATETVNATKVRDACFRSVPHAVGNLVNLLALKPVLATASSEQSGHAAHDAIDDNRTTYWGCLPQRSASTVQSVTVDLGTSHPAITGARLWPRSGFVGWPPAWTLEVAEALPAFRPVQQVQQTIVRGAARDATYVQFAPIGGRYVRLSAQTLAPKTADSFVCEVADIQVVVRTLGAPILSPAPVEEAVGAILRHINWQEVYPNPLAKFADADAAVRVAAVLRDGVASEALRGLGDVGGDPESPGAARAAYRTAREALFSRLAKWAGARFAEEPDPNIRGLGFMQLQQTVAPGAATFDLFPADDAAATGTSMVLRPADPRNGGDKVYAPLQNLGLGGVLQIEAPGAAAALIADIILEIRMRGCYDPQLAATVRANEQQRSQQIDRMVDLGAAQSRVLQLGTPAVTTTVTEPRSAQFSFRTNRDRILQAAIAGAQVKAGTVDLTGEQIVDGLTFVAGAPEVAPLARGAAFSYFGDPKPKQIALVFTRNPATPLGDQIAKIVVTPDTLGVDTALLDALPDDGEIPKLTSLAVVIVRARRFGSDPVPSEVSALLKPLLPASWSSRTRKITQAVSMTTRAQSAASAVPLSSLWPVSGALVVTLDVGDLIANGQLYDILFTVTANVPRLCAQTTSPDFF